MKFLQWVAPTLVLSTATGLLAFGGPDHDGRREAPPPPGCPRDSARRHAIKPLTDEHKAFLKAERAMRDSMDGAIRAYAESVRKGSDPRSMVSDRAIIVDFDRRLERLRMDNVDVWLDLLADHPMRMGGGPRGRDGMTRPPRLPGDSLPPPPPPSEGDSAADRP